MTTDEIGATEAPQVLEMTDLGPVPVIPGIDEEIGAALDRAAELRQAREQAA